MAANARGRVLYLVMEKGFINANIYADVLREGSYAKDGVSCYLCAADGVRINDNNNLRVDNSLFVYPGNPEQALENQNADHQNWGFTGPTVPQGGSGLAAVAGKLTDPESHMDGAVHPLPTLHDKRHPQFQGNVELQDELGLFAVNKLWQRNQDGMNVIIPVVPHSKDCVFNKAQAVVNSDSEDYYLAFWGGAADTPGQNNLPQLYSEALSNLPAFTPEKEQEQKELMSSKRDVLAALNQYAIAPFNFYHDGKRAAVVSFFGGLSGQHKHEEDVRGLAKKVHDAQDNNELQGILESEKQKVVLEDGGYKDSIAAALRVLDPSHGKSSSISPVLR